MASTGVVMGLGKKVVQCWWCGKEIEWKSTESVDGDTHFGAWKNLFCSDACNLAYCREKVRLMGHEDQVSDLEENAAGNPTAEVADAAPENQVAGASEVVPENQKNLARRPRATQAQMDERTQEAWAMVQAGCPRAEVLRKTGIHKKAWIDLMFRPDLPEFCKCGYKYGHRGSCHTGRMKRQVPEVVKQPVPPKAVVPPRAIKSDGMPCAFCDKPAVRRIFDGTYRCKDHLEGVGEARGGLTLGIHREAATKMVPEFQNLAIDRCPVCLQVDVVCECEKPAPPENRARPREGVVEKIADSTHKVLRSVNVAKVSPAQPIDQRPQMRSTYRDALRQAQDELDYLTERIKGLQALVIALTPLAAEEAK